ncbi:DUF1566 domain-containing protein [Rhodoferax ferrireducens]|uniref:DUF1566 domain-containing protein n=1 Tax=Rhodoferax ferrireducens TaxID=192843 RepID=UPI000E0D3971|nr:DUF1566 domain-containing protein [Rhodoferax ferrireducens]
MLLTPITLPVTLELCSKSKALLDFLRTQETGATPAPLVKPTDTPTPPAMGEYWPGQGGRYLCTLPALLGMPARHLIAGDGEAEDLKFGPSIDVPGATSQIDGAANTDALCACSESHPAAKWARAYRADGHTDFFLPAKLDLVMSHICAPQIFKTSSDYWTSTQGSRSSAFVQDFEDGYSGWYSKGSGHRVRAFRVIPLEPLNT